MYTTYGGVDIWKPPILYGSAAIFVWCSAQWAPWLVGIPYFLVVFVLPTALIIAALFPVARRPILLPLARIAGWLYRTLTGTLRQTD